MSIIFENSKNQNLNKLIIKGKMGVSMLGESPFTIIYYGRYSYIITAFYIK